MTTKKPRGLRNNNPGNIRHSKYKWQGMAANQNDPSFVTFKDPVYGIRAIARLLINYRDLYNCFTLRDIISRWAPPRENNTKAYIDWVADRMKISGAQEIDVHQYEILRPLVDALIRYENGGQNPYTAAQMDKALVLAGVEPKRKSIANSRTVIGTSATLAGGTASEIVQETKDQLEPLAAYADTLKILFLVIALLGIGLTLYARWDDRRKGIS